MERRVIPKKRIGSFYDDMGMSMRMRQDKGRHRTLDAAEGSAYGQMSVSLCGIPLESTEAFRFLPLTAQVMEKKRNKEEKEVKKEKDRSKGKRN